MEYLNHLKIDYTPIEHKKKNIVTSLNSVTFETFLKEIDTYEFRVGTVPAGFEHRADLISNLFYETPTLDWLICWYNNISDPFQQLNVGDKIRIPLI